MVTMHLAVLHVTIQFIYNPEFRKQRIFGIWLYLVDRVNPNTL